MLAGQKSKGNNGLENALFPLEYMYLTQGENTGNHTGNSSLAMDFQGWGSSGRIYNCPYYSPISLQCVYLDGTSGVYFESLNMVNFIDGTVDYLSIAFAHDDNWQSNYVGKTFNQGDLIGHTGTSGVATGDHVHIQIARGKFINYSNFIVNTKSLYDTLGVNDTILYNAGSYNWLSFLYNYQKGNLIRLFNSNVL